MKDIFISALCGVVGWTTALLGYGWVDEKSKFNPKGAILNFVLVMIIVCVFNILGASK